MLILDEEVLFEAMINVSTFILLINVLVRTIQIFSVWIKITFLIARNI